MATPCSLDQSEVGASLLAERDMTGERWTEEMRRRFGDSFARNQREVFRMSAERFSAAAGREKAARAAAELLRTTAEHRDAEVRQKAARRDLARAIASVEKSTLSEIVSAVRKAGMLTGIKTHLRNVIGTAAFQVGEEIARVPAAITDMVTSAVTGTRTITGPNARAIAGGAYDAATKGIAEAREILSRGASNEELERLQLGRELNSNSRILNGYVNGVFRLLSAEDRVIRTFALRRALEDRARAQAITERRSDPSVDVAARTKALVADPPEAMAADALADAEIAVFQNENALSSRISKFRGDRRGAANAAIDLVLPFDRTPVNLYLRTLDYSPVGLGKAVYQGRNLPREVARRLAGKDVGELFTPADQRAFAQSIGRGSVGTALIALGWMLAANGSADTTDVSGTRDDDPGRSTRDFAAGRTPLSIRLGGTWYSLGALNPLAILMAVGATLQREATQERRDPTQTAGELAGVLSQTALDLPMMRATKDLVGAVQEPGTVGEKLVGGIASTIVPTAVGDVANALDAKRRDTRGGILRPLESRVPGLRNTLPESTDALGRPVEQRRANAVNPFVPSTAREVSDSVDRELARLDVPVSNVKQKPGESEAAWRARAEAVGRERYRRLEAVAARPLADDAKRKAMTDAIREATERVNKRFGITGE